MKKIIKTLIVLVIVTIILFGIKLLLFGTEEIYIADYMPRPCREEPCIEREPFEIVAKKSILIYIIPFAVCNLVFTIVYLIIEIKKKQINSVLDALYILLILIVPLIIVGIVIYNKFDYTW